MKPALRKGHQGEMTRERVGGKSVVRTMPSFRA